MIGRTAVIDSFLLFLRINAQICTIVLADHDRSTQSGNKARSKANEPTDGMITFLVHFAACQVPDVLALRRGFFVPRVFVLSEVAPRVMVSVVIAFRIVVVIALTAPAKLILVKR